LFFYRNFAFFIKFMRYGFSYTRFLIIFFDASFLILLLIVWGVNGCMRFSKLTNSLPWVIGKIFKSINWTHIFLIMWSRSMVIIQYNFFLLMREELAICWCFSIIFKYIVNLWYFMSKYYFILWFLCFSNFIMILMVL